MNERKVKYNNETKQWTCTDLDGTTANFKSINDLRDWLDFQEMVLKAVRGERNERS